MGDATQSRALSTPSRPVVACRTVVIGTHEPTATSVPSLQVSWGQRPSTASRTYSRIAFYALSGIRLCFVLEDVRRSDRRMLQCGSWGQDCCC